MNSARSQVQQLLDTHQKGEGTMIKRLILVLTLASLLATTANAIPTRRGKRGRKYLRRSHLRSGFKADKLEIYGKYGYPIHRLRVNGYGRVLEHWKYYEHGKEFIFDANSRLVKVNNFWPEDKRARFKQFSK